MVDALPRRRAISRITRHHSELAHSPSLARSFLREERKLASKIKTLDANKNHLISHLDSEIEYFRKACCPEMCKISADDFEMSLISEDGSNVSNEKEISGEEHEPAPNKLQKACIKEFAGKSSDKIGVLFIRPPRKEFYRNQGGSQVDHNGSFSKSHDCHLKFFPPQLHHRQLQRHCKYGGEKASTSICQENDKNPNRHHFVSMELENHRRHYSCACCADNSTRREIPTLCDSIKPARQRSANHMDKDLQSQVMELENHRRHHNFDGSGDHDIRRESSPIPNLYNSMKPARQRSSSHVDKELQSQVIGINISDLAKKSRNSPIFVRKSFPCSTTGNVIPNTTSESLLLHRRHTLHFGLDFIPIKDHNRTGLPGSNVNLNPMLFHPSFNNMTKFPDEDQNSFQVLKKCRYLRIPRRHLSPEMESMVD